MKSSLFVALGAAGAIIGCAGVSAWRERRSFEERFPAISEAEFMDRCGPGTDPQIAARVRRILAECLDMDEERIYPGSRLQNDLGVR